MVKLGLTQTILYISNEKGLSQIAETLKTLGNKETEIVCLPEQ
ncbi:MAG: hypothetical protein ACRBB5_08725 [Nitrosopumilus sp.]